MSEEATHQETNGTGKTIRALLFTNIITIFGAVVTIVWNAGILNQRVDTLRENQASIVAVQGSTVNQVVEHHATLEDISDDLQVINDRLFRLESYHLRPGG